MKRVRKKLLSALLTCCMLVSIFSMNAFALGDKVVLAGNVMINDTIYDDLNSAVAAAGADDVIQLGSDQLLNVCYLTKPITIEGNGYTVTVPPQTSKSGSLNDGDGKFILQSSLTFKNTAVNFENPKNWSLVMSGTGVLSLLEGTECSFKYCGIYASPNAVVNVDASNMTLENMTYTSMMAEAYATLNITNNSVFQIKAPMDINGITSFNINVDNSKLTISDCQRQGLVNSSLTLTNGAEVLFDNDYTGYNMYSGNKLTVNDGTKLTMINCGSRALMTQGSSSNPASIVVKAGGTFNCQYNGKDWKASDDEDKHYATKGAITLGCYGWYSAANKIYFYSNNTITFEDGANVNISDNYVRGIFNNGITYIGNTTKIMNNGMVEADEDCRVGAGGGIYNRATLTIADGAMVYNNHARTEGDDLYNTDGKTLNLVSTGDDWTLDDCGDAITGWFHDGYRNVDDTIETDRWNVIAEDKNCMNKDTAYAHEYTVADSTTERLSLKAAHPALFRVTVNYYKDSVTNSADTETFLGSAVLDGYFTAGTEIALPSGTEATELDYLQPENYNFGEQVGTTPYIVVEDGENVINVLYVAEEVIPDDDPPLAPPANGTTEEIPGEQPPLAPPVTGDTMSIEILVTLLIAAAFLGVIFCYKKRKAN